MKTSKRITRFVNEELLDGVPSDVDALATGLLDSLSIEQLIAFIEETYEFTFADEELIAENFASVDIVAKLVDSKRTRR